MLVFPDLRFCAQIVENANGMKRPKLPVIRFFIFSICAQTWKSEKHALCFHCGFLNENKDFLFLFLFLVLIWKTKKNEMMLGFWVSDSPDQAFESRPLTGHLTNYCLGLQGPEL